MKLFDSPYFCLDYDPQFDIIHLELPDMVTVGLSQAQHCLGIMVETVRNFQINYLIIDSSRANVTIDEERYNQLIYEVSVELKKTSLRKVARIVSRNTNLEQMARKVQQQVLQTAPEVYQIRNFTDVCTAREWLASKTETKIMPSVH